MAMNRYTPEELAKVLAAHKKWPLNEDGGLQGEPLRGGTLEEFTARVHQEHATNPIYLAEYLAAIAMFTAVREAHPTTGEATQKAAV